MALTATFVADFSSFQDAVANAQVSLKSFEGNANKVGSALNRMTESLSGKQVIQQATLMAEAIDRIGGPSKLTANELQRVSAQATEAAAKMRAMGMDVPPGIQKIADATKNVGAAATGSTTLLSSMEQQLVRMFTIGAVVAFGRELLRMGDDIVRVSDRTGLFTDEVQRLSFIAKQSGNSLDELVGAIGQLQNRLASGDSSAVGAVKALGISFQELRAAGPYQQLQLIADAVGKIPDPAGRAQVAMDLFGRAGIAILPTLQAEFSKLGDAAPVMAYKTVLALDQAGDALDKFQLQIKVWAAGSYNLLGKFFDQFSALVLRFTAGFLDVTANIASVFQNLKFPGADKLFPGLASGLDAVRERAQFARDAARLLTTTTEDMGTQVRKATPLFTGLGDSMKASGEAAKKIAKAQEDIADAIAKTKAAVVPLTEAQKAQAIEWNKSNIAVGLMATQLRISDIAVKTYLDSVEKATAGQKKFEESVRVFGKLTTQVVPLTQFRDVIAGIYQLDLPNLSYELMASQVQLDRLGNAVKVHLVPSLEKLGGVLDQQRLKVASFADNLKSSLAGIPDILKQAFTGGGDLIGAMKAIGVDLANAITAPIIEGLSKLQKHAVSAGTAAAAGLGGAVGGGIGATVAGISAGLGGAAFAASSMGVAMAKAGVMGALGLSAVTLGIGAAAVGVVMLTKKWLAHRKEVKENTKAIASFQESIWATLTPAQVMEAQGRTWAATVIGVRDAYLATGRSATEAEADVKAMWDSTTKGAAASQAAMARVNQAFVEQREHAESLALGFQTLEETARKYNLTIEEMGPAWQRQELDKKAQELFKDYQILTSAGVDHVLVLGKMAGAVNKYVQDAVKMGIEVPAAMRPMLEDMVKSGKLFDANGVKIENLEAAGISFAMTLSEGFKALIAEVQKLTDAISRGLGLAIQNVPDGDFTIRGKVVMPDKLPKGYDLPDVEMMASGGRGVVNKPTLFMAGEAGSEEFAFSGANRRLGAGDNVVDFAAMKTMFEAQQAELRGLRRDMDRRDREQPFILAMALKDAQAHS